MILATSNVNSKLHLIQTEFPNQESVRYLNGGKTRNKTASNKLYTDCIMASDKNGISVRKDVGGPLRRTQVMEDLLSRPSSFPKKRRSVVFLKNSKDKNNLITLYIQNKEKKKKDCRNDKTKPEKRAIFMSKYNQPTRGGTFLRKPELRDEQVLLDLVEATFVTAKILEQVNITNTITNTLPGAIQPNAVAQHLAELDEAYKHTQTLFYNNKTERKSAMLDYISNEKKGSSKFHLVAHACAYHTDNNCGGSSLESKAFFSTSNLTNGKGRGGILPQRLRGGAVVALMNHEEKRRAARTAARRNREATT